MNTIRPIGITSYALFIAAVVACLMCGACNEREKLTTGIHLDIKGGGMLSFLNAKLTFNIDERDVEDFRDRLQERARQYKVNIMLDTRTGSFAARPIVCKKTDTFLDLLNELQKEGYRIEFEKDTVWIIP